MEPRAQLDKSGTQIEFQAAFQSANFDPSPGAFPSQSRGGIDKLRCHACRTLRGNHGIVTETGMGRAAYRIGCRDGSAVLPPSSLPARDHPARDLALSPLYPELPRCRGIAGRTRACHLIRDGAAMG